MQAANDPESSLQAKVLPDSVDVKLKVALAFPVDDAGLAVMVVSGGVMSTTHASIAGVGSVLPAASVAPTWKVWLPEAKPL